MKCVTFLVKAKIYNIFKRKGEISVNLQKQRFFCREKSSKDIKKAAGLLKLETIVLSEPAL